MPWNPWKIMEGHHPHHLRVRMRRVVAPRKRRHERGVALVHAVAEAPLEALERRTVRRIGEKAA
jgi:hypothetical protein